MRPVVTLFLLAMLGCNASPAPRPMAFDEPPLPAEPATRPAAEFTLTEFYHPETAKGVVYYRLTYKMAGGGDMIVFKVLESHPNRAADELVLPGGGKLPPPLGTVIECEVPARDLRRCIDAPLDSYDKRPWQELAEEYAKNRRTRSPSTQPQ